MNPTPSQSNVGKYFIGLGLGFIPLVLFLVGFGISRVPQFYFLGFLVSMAFILQVLVLIAAIVCLFMSSVRVVGYGLLTAFFVNPVVASIGCSVLFPNSYVL